MMRAAGTGFLSPHASAIVASLPPEKIDEVFTLLEALERAAYRAACRERTDKDLEDLVKHVRQMDEVIAEPDPADC